MKILNMHFEIYTLCILNVCVMYALFRHNLRDRLNFDYSLSFAKEMGKYGFTGRNLL